MLMDYFLLWLERKLLNFSNTNLGILAELFDGEDIIMY